MANRTESGPQALSRGLGVLVFALSSLFYLLTTGQHTFWLDSAEFVTMAAAGGIAHPPGTPLYTALAHLWTLLPLGGVAFRVHLLSALLGGLFAALLYLLGLEAGGRDAGSAAAGGCSQPASGRWWGPLPAAAVALAFALCPAIWFQSVRAEVYALNGALTAGMVLLALRWPREPDRDRCPLLLGLLFGLGLANHHFLALLTFAACGVVALLHAGCRKRLLSLSVLKFAAFVLPGLLVYLYLPLRAAAGWHWWGDPGTLAGLEEIVSARAYHISVTEMPRAPFFMAVLLILEKWIDLLGYPLFLAGFVGLAALLLAVPRVGLLLLLLVFAGAASKAVMYLDVENPDDHAYFLIGLAPLAACACALLRLPVPPLLRGRERLVAAVVAGVVVAAAAGSGAALLAAHRSRCDLSHFPGGDALNRHFHETLPPDALFLPSYYATFFNHLYYRQVEQRRPDVTLVHQSLFSRYGDGRGYARDTTAGHPEVQPVFDEFFATGAFPLPALTALSTRIPVMLENDTQEVVGEPAFAAYSLGAGGLTVPPDRLLYRGAALQLVSASPRSGGTPVLHRFWSALYRDLVAAPVHPELSKLLVWYHYRNALLFINQRQWMAALLEARMARRLTPGTERLFELESALDDRLARHDAGE